MDEGLHSLTHAIVVHHLTSIWWWLLRNRSIGRPDEELMVPP